MKEYRFIGIQPPNSSAAENLANKMAADGWELVAVSANTLYAIFVREWVGGQQTGGMS